MRVARGPKDMPLIFSVVRAGVGSPGVPTGEVPAADVTVLVELTMNPGRVVALGSRRHHDRVPMVPSLRCGCWRAGPVLAAWVLLWRLGPLRLPVC
jgi:hypothetical protein